MKKIKLKLVTNGLKCLSCGKNSLEEEDNDSTFTPTSMSTPSIVHNFINYDKPRKFKCRLCLAEHKEIK